MILVAGSTGLVGSALIEILKNQNYEFIGISSRDVDLRDIELTNDLFAETRPTVVINAAARVGGISDNMSKPVEFLSDNLYIQTNLMNAAHRFGVEKLVFLGSSCVYPREAIQPMKEDYLMTGKLEPTNSAYAIAKLAGLELVNSYNRQFGHRWISVMPSNVYGPNDHFNSLNSHVIPGLISRIWQAKCRNKYSVEIWGSGEARREFLFSLDLADALIYLMQIDAPVNFINVGTGSDIRISELAILIARLMNFEGNLVFNSNFPDGSPRKLLDVSKMDALGWQPKIGLIEGLKVTIDWFLKSDFSMLEKVSRG